MHTLRNNTSKMTRQLLKSMDVDADKENKYLEKMFFSVCARAKQVASTAFNGGATALFENARSHFSDRNQCSTIETRSKRTLTSKITRQAETQPQRVQPQHGATMM